MHVCKACNKPLKRDIGEAPADFLRRSHCTSGCYRHLKGERRRQKLTPEIVREIRRAYSEGQLQREIAARFGVTGGLVSAVITRRSWGDVE
jgi:hypothetical protein